MKKSKILIPAASILSVGAIAIPFTSSCNKTTISGINVSLVEGSKNEWASEKHSFEKDKSVTYIGDTFVMRDPEDTDWNLYIETKDSNDNLIPIKAMKLNGVEKEVNYTPAGPSYFCVIGNKELKFKTKLVFEVTYKTDGVDCISSLDLDNE